MTPEQQALLNQRAQRIRTRREIEDRNEETLKEYIEEGIAILEPDGEWLYYPPDDMSPGQLEWLDSPKDLSIRIFKKEGGYVINRMWLGAIASTCLARKNQAGEPFRFESVADAKWYAMRLCHITREDEWEWR